MTNELVGKVVAITGTSSDLPHHARQQGRSIYDDMARMIRWLDEGTIRPIIARTFSLSEAGRAQAMLEADKPIGKIVLIP